jgi:hypothetical protein
VTLGWDWFAKNYYYLYLAGGSLVYRGTARLEDDGLHIDFETMAGPSIKYRTVMSFPEKDVCRIVTEREKDGHWIAVMDTRMKRKPSAAKAP